MSDLDRILANNQNSSRMNQAKQIAVTTAEIALLAVGIKGISALGKKAGNLAHAAAGTIHDVAGEAAAKKAIAEAAARKSRETVTKTVLKNKAAAPLEKNLKAGYDTLFDVGKKKLQDAKFLHPKENILGQTIKKLDKEKILHAFHKGSEFVGKEVLSEVRSEVTSEVKKQLPPQVAALVETQEKLSGVRNSLNAFKGTLPVDANKIINTVSKITLGKTDLTHGIVGYTNKVLKGTVGPGKNTIKAQETVATMTTLENKTNGAVEKNLKILKAAGVKDLPAKAITKKEQEAIMTRQVPDKILKETDWVKNKTEFLALRSDIDGLGSKIVAINRGSFDIAKETGNLQIMGEQQAALAEQVKTFIQNDDKLALIADKTTEEIMNKNFLTSLNITNAPEVYALVDNYAVLGTRKNILTGELQAQLTEGSAQMKYMVGKTTSDLLGDTKRMLETAAKDAEDEDRSEEDIRRLRKA